MKKDYETEAEREAYNKGLIAHINSLNKTDNPYIYDLVEHETVLFNCWLAGFEEKGSIKEKTK